VEVPCLGDAICKNWHGMNYGQKKFFEVGMLFSSLLDILFMFDA
jgi:hypothetical protein